MRRVAAPLAAVLAAAAIGACGDDGAEPGAPQGATLVLDFTPNAVHAGLFAAQRRGYFEDAGVELEIREPSSSADGAKLLQAGQADFAILDINDLGIARQEGADLVAIAAIVQRPLAAVIAADRRDVERPLDLAGGTVGVTGVPSDDAVLDAVLRSDGIGPGEVERTTIGFNSVAALASGRVDAATAFWNAEGVQLREMGIPTNEFRVDEFGAGRYPELVVAVTGEYRRDHRGEACALVKGLGRGYAVLAADPPGALDDLLAENAGLERRAQTLQLDALLAGNAFSERASEPGASIELDLVPALDWLEFATTHGLLDVGTARERDEILEGLSDRFAQSCRRRPPDGGFTD
jgi:NitT/TauT family transport system substrate-binding protein/putative hydroxymethylpyrimidine transport system substrate-binding protein